MTIDAGQKRLADKILKLLAVASSTRFAEEADTARRMAEDLMRTHNVKLGPGKPSQDTIERREYVPFAKGMRWEGIIVGALSDLCSCAYFFRKETLDSYALVGTIWNLDVLDYMVREVNRQRIAAWLAYKGSGQPDSFNKFCYGFAQALQNKIERLVNHEQVAQTSRALTLWYEMNVLHSKVKSVSLAMGAASSQAGLAAGKDASLHRGALGTPQRLLGYKK
jgi:Protein of unknown function (DUF2786)